MAISTQEQVDFLWKRILYGVSKTASSTAKFASNETVPSALVVLPSSVWKEGDTIPASPPGSTTSLIEVHTGASSIKMSSDPTSPPNVAWQAASTFNNLSTRMTDFIPPTFGVPYAVQVWIGNPSGGPAARVFPDTTGEEWVFDYAAGVLIFTGTIPANKAATVGSGNVSVASQGVYIQAYRYVGAKGVGLSQAELPFIPHTLGQLADVEDGTGTPLDGYVLTFKDGVWQAEPLPLPQDALGRLTDVSLDTLSPGDVLTYDDVSGKWENKPVAADLAQLNDVDFGSLVDGDLLTYDHTAGKWENKPAPTSTGVDRFTDLLDTAGPYVGHQGYVVRVNNTADGLEYFQLPVTVSTFLQLSDTPTSYTSKANFLVRVNAVGTGLEFVQAPFVPSRLGQLSDVEDGTGTPQSGQVLTWKDGVWQAETSRAGVDPGDLGTMAYQNSDSVAITGGTISGVTIDGGTF